MIKQATSADIPRIEEIMLDAVHWLKQIGAENLWTETSVKWESLSKDFSTNDFYILYDQEEPAACMALTRNKDFYWPEIPEGESLFLHKLAVKRSFSGKGISKELIDYAKTKAKELHCDSVRLDCKKHADKLRKLYEKNGFVFVDEVFIGDYGVALYKYDL